MQVDRDDRYVSEQPNKDSTPSFRLPNILPNFSKTKLIILGLTIVIILLLLSLIIFRSSHKNEPTLLTTPPVVNGDSTTDDNGTLTDENVNSLALPDDVNSTTDPQDSTLNPPSNQTDGQSNPNGLTNEQNTNQTTTSEQRGRTNTPSAPNNINGVNGSSNSQSVESNQSQNTPERNTLNNEGELNLAKTGKLESNHFSIQISASTSLNKLKKFANEHKITNYQIYETKRNNSPWFVLIKGNYSSANDAKKAIQALPSSLQKDKPWVKPAATINKEKAIK